MKRSYTVDFAAAQAEDSPVPQQQSKSSKERLLTPTDEEEDLESYGELEDVGVPVRRSSNHLVTAIIESSPHTREQRGEEASVATSEEVASCSSEIVPRMSSGSLIKRDNINEQVHLRGKKVNEKIGETLFTFKLDSADLISIWRDFFHHK